MPSTRIAPSILAADFGRLADEVRACEVGGADLIHVDVMDGRFVPNLTIGPPVVAALRRATRLPLDVHLMIEEPGRYIDDFVRAGADLISVHVEACPHLHRVLQQIRSAGRRAAVALNPATPIETLAHVVDELSMVLVMSVNPGFGGQAYIPAATPKLAALRRFLDERGHPEIDIEVDGGVKLDNVATVTAAGADVVVSGSGIFGLATDGAYGPIITALRARGDEARLVAA